MSKLELKKLRKEFSSEIIPVKDISIEVEDGEFLTFVGPSGCGKSTLLRLIAGLDQPTRGNVLIGGRNVNSIPPGQRNIAMVFQSYALYPHMTVVENISTSLKLRKIPQAEIQRRVNEITTKLGLNKVHDRKPAKLSGGQRQRVALARALVREPDIFLLDEPLSNLDALLREEVRAELKQLFASQNKPVVYVTHDQTEAMTLSTKIAVLCDGVLQQLDTPHTIYSYPANDFVAKFMGSPQMNLLELKCEGNFALLGDLKIPLPNLPIAIPEVVFGIRPEDVRLARTQDNQTIKGKVNLVENLGKDKLISVQIDGLNKPLRALLPADQNWDGDGITLSLLTQGMHWFDAVSGNRFS